jgi:hypothetical protein
MGESFVKWHVVGWDGPTVNTWEVEADHVMPGSAWLTFHTGTDPMTRGINEAMPTEVARFVTENVFCYYPVEIVGHDGSAQPLTQRVKRID